MAKIKVTIEASQLFRFNQDVEMEQEDFDKVKHLDIDDVGNWSTEDSEAYSVLENYINPNDVFEAREEYTDVSITLTKVSAK